MKKRNFILLLSLLLLPVPVLADDFSDMNIFMIFFFHLFATIHFTFMVAMPISDAIASKTNDASSKFVLKIDLIRLAICLVLDLTIGAFAIVVDFFFLFALALFCSFFLKVTKFKRIVPTASNQIANSAVAASTLKVKVCPDCHEEWPESFTECENCGTDLSNIEAVSKTAIKVCPGCQGEVPGTAEFCPLCGKDIKDVESKENSVIDDSGYAEPDSSYDNPTLYIKNMVTNALNSNLEKGQVYTSDAMQKKDNVSTALFMILNVVFIIFIFFHMPIWTYLIELVNIHIYRKSKKRKVEDEIVKQITNRPDEDMDNIIATEIAKLRIVGKRPLKAIAILASFLVPLIFFINPHYIYEDFEDGYSLRFYSMGLSNMTSVNVPSTYKGKKVYEIRGDVFSNMFLLKEVTIEEGIVNLRGTNFMNDILLKSVSLPSSINHIGAQAFYNCKSLKYINLEDTQITKVSEKTFYGCTSLEKIEIPEGVIKISARAFFGNTSLSEVKLPYSLEEIGSSAFRECDSLRNISIPNNCIVNERAFKNSPTYITRV